MLSALLFTASAVAADVTITVNPKNVTHRVNPLFNGCHSDSGYTHQPRGLYAQMVLGESFEGLGPKQEQLQLAADAEIAAFPVGKTVSLASMADPAMLLRHCDFAAFVGSCPCNPDFDFTVVKGLNGAAGSVSFQSANFPTKYLSATPAGAHGSEKNRVTVTGVDKDAASWSPVAGLSDPTKYSFKSLSKQPLTAGGYLTSTTKATGTCAGGANKGDVVVLKSTPSKAAATWETHPFPPAPPPPKGPWGTYNTSGAVGTAAITDADSFHGKDSLAVSMTSGTGVIGMSNRGLGHEGLVFQASKEYEGYFFAKSSSTVTFTVAIVDYEKKKTLASKEIKFTGGNWTMLNFTLTPSGSTDCVGLDPTIDDPDVDCGKMGPHSHVCVKCGGEFVIGLSSNGEASIDYITLFPGAWGVVPGSNPLGGGPALASAASVLKTMGINIIRQGGSFADGSYYYWKNWRGLPWTRESLGAEWGGVGTIISGWGPFEMMDFCDAVGIEPVFTTNAVGPETPEDMADLVEYLYGGENTTWGKLRIQDGRTKPYETKFFELGNEQYNPSYPEQVAAMEAKAKELGQGGKLFYMNPNNAKWLKPDDAAKVEAIGIKDHAVMDIHLGGGGGVKVAETMFNSYPNYTMGAVNAETNAGTHTMSRAMSEATDLNDWFNCGEVDCTRLHFRTASFCDERSGHFDAFDQGISFFLPNMTWIQPPGYVHSMIADTWQPNGIETSARVPYNAPGQTIGASAQASDDGKTVVVRITNMGMVAANVELNVGGFTHCAGNDSGSNAAPPETWTLQSVFANGTVDENGANDPGNPTAISPVKGLTEVDVGAGKGGGDSMSVPAYSYVVVEYAA